MKKVLVLILALLMIMALTACGGGKSAEAAFVGEWISDMDVHLVVEDGVRFFNAQGITTYYHADDYEKVAEAN